MSAGVRQAVTRDFGELEQQRVIMTWQRAHTLLLTGQITLARYLKLCREHGWPTDRVPPRS